MKSNDKSLSPFENPIFITTTLPYANSTPHVGHCLEFVQADALARYFRVSNFEVTFNIGLDEHGLKIHQEALRQNIPTQQFVDSIAEKWYTFCKTFNISYDNFYRTTDPAHHKKVQKYWLDLLEAGDIYQKFYTAKYCVGCEEFKTETQIENSKCNLHPTLELQEISEQNWFLKLSKYKDQILKYADSNDSFFKLTLKPASKKKELLNLIKDAEDISISRRRDLLPWGVQVPNDSTQTIYVWFEALLNYYFACGEENWNGDTYKIQLCGPDNLKFQALIWQGILLANKNKFSDAILVHGTILDSEGNKMSKSVGNVIDPIVQVEKYGLDAVRYYILKSLHTYQNSNWNEKDLVESFNNDLANNFGNLVSRVLHLIESKNVIIKPFKADPEFFDTMSKICDEIDEYWTDCEISQALQKTQELVAYGNKYINDQKPWSNPDVLVETLSNLYHLLFIVADYYEPVIPNSIENVLQALKDKKKVIAFNRLQLPA